MWPYAKQRDGPQPGLTFVHGLIPLIRKGLFAGPSTRLLPVLGDTHFRLPRRQVSNDHCSEEVFCGPRPIASPLPE